MTLTIKEVIKSVFRAIENQGISLTEFLTKSSDAPSYQNIVGSQLQFIKDRLDSLLNASHKGTHTTIISKEDANRIVVYTYLLIGDILSLVKS